MIASTKAMAVCGLVLFGAAASAQPRPAPEPPGPAAAAAQPGQPGGALTADQLEQLLSPIALYPDPLLANVLAACVYTNEVAQTASFMRAGGGPQAVASQPWEPPVKAIAEVPEVLLMLGEFPEWTTALGRAYLTRAQDMMATIQSLRQRAHSSGALKTNEQQHVVVEQETIYIQPSDPDGVYVPSYEPSVVYVDDDDDDVWAAGLIGVGRGVAVGAIWSDLDCDWHHGCIGWGEADTRAASSRGSSSRQSVSRGSAGAPRAVSRGGGGGGDGRRGGGGRR